MEEMHLKAEVQIFWKTCGVQISLIRFTLKHNLNIIFAEGFAIILSPVALLVFY